MALPMLLPSWAWILIAVMLGLLTTGSIGIMARRQTIFDIL